MKLLFFFCVIFGIQTQALAQNYGIKEGFARMEAQPIETQTFIDELISEVANQLICGHRNALEIYLDSDRTVYDSRVKELKLTWNQLDAIEAKAKDYAQKNWIQKWSSPDSEDSIFDEYIAKKQKAEDLQIKLSLDPYRFNSDLTELLMWSMFTYRDLLVGNEISPVRFDSIEKYAKNLGCDLRSKSTAKALQKYNSLAAGIQPKFFDDFAARGLSLRFAYSLIQGTKSIPDEYLPYYFQQQGYALDIEKSNLLLPEIKALETK